MKSAIVVTIANSTADAIAVVVVINSATMMNRMPVSKPVFAATKKCFSWRAEKLNWTIKAVHEQPALKNLSTRILSLALFVIGE